MQQRCRKPFGQWERTKDQNGKRGNATKRWHSQRRDRADSPHAKREVTPARTSAAEIHAAISTFAHASSRRNFFVSSIANQARRAWRQKCSSSGGAEVSSSASGATAFATSRRQYDSS